MTFARKPPVRPPRPRRTLGGSGLVVRAFLLGAVAIAGATWALARHYSHPMPPMRVPIPSAAPTYDADAGEVPVPELIEPGR